MSYLDINDYSMAPIYILFGIILFFTVIIYLSIIFPEFAHGQDLDMRYYCIENPHYRSCDPQLQADKKAIMEILNDVLKSLNNSDSAWYNDSVKRSLNSS